jgi:hypothetical protein
MADDLLFRRNLSGINESLRNETLEGRSHVEDHSRTSKGTSVSRYSISEDCHTEKSKDLIVENSETEIVKQIMSVDLKGSYLICRIERDRSGPPFQKYHQYHDIKGHVALWG